MGSLPLELLENITAWLPPKHAQALEGPAFSSVVSDRLNPVVYLSSAFSYCVSLIAAMVMILAGIAIGTIPDGKAADDKSPLPGVAPTH